MSDRIKALNEVAERKIKSKPFFRRPSILTESNSTFLGKYNWSDLYLFDGDVLATVAVNEKTLSYLSGGYSVLPVSTDLSLDEAESLGMIHSVARYIATQLGALPVSDFTR